MGRNVRGKAGNPAMKWKRPPAVFVLKTEGDLKIVQFSQGQMKREKLYGEG